MSKSKLKGGIGWTTWHHLRRAPFQSLTAILVMWLNFLAVTALLTLIFLFSSLLNYFETRPEVTAFLKDKVDQTQIEQVRQQLVHFPGVKEVRFISKEEALKIYREQNKDNPLLLEMVSAEILPASLEISAINPEYLTPIANFLNEKKELVEEVIFQRDVVDRLAFWIRTIRNGGLAIVGFLSFVSLVVIIVIIGMKIATHRQEIGILRSLGATNFYIQAPFLLEGFLYGLVGAFLGILLISGLVYYWRSQIEGFFKPIIVFPQDWRLIGLVLSVELVVGGLLGLIGAWLASHRYLKR